MKLNFNPIPFQQHVCQIPGAIKRVAFDCAKGDSTADTRLPDLNEALES
jgi:hypothetical protein